MAAPAIPIDSNDSTTVVTSTESEQPKLELVPRPAMTFPFPSWPCSYCLTDTPQENIEGKNTGFATKAHISASIHTICSVCNRRNEQRLTILTRDNGH